MTDAELNSYLFADRLEQAELEHVTLGHFGRSSTEGKHTTYRRDGSEAWLRIDYTNAHSIRGFTRSANYPESDIRALRDRIRAELVDGQETKVAQVVCFAYNQVTGWARGSIRGIDFQMMPLPPGNATVGFDYGRHPFTLEVTFQVSPNFMIRHQRVQRSAITVTRFLNLLLARPIEMSERSADHAWVVDVQQSDENVDTTSRYMQLGYFPVGLSLLMDQLSDVSALSPIPRIPARDYYSRRGIELGPLSLPNTFGECLQIASQLSTSSYNKLLIALTFFAMSHDVWRASRSSSYASLVAAIEALLPESNRQSCKVCGQPIYQISKRFRDFLTRYAPGREQAPDRKALQNAFYELRSGLAHGTKVLQSDLEPWKFHDRGGQLEDDLHRRLQEVVRIAILNWLGSPEPAHGLISEVRGRPHHAADNALKRLARNVWSILFPSQNRR
jgi:hypothetical protein